MNWSNYIPLLVVFIVFFRSAIKKNGRKTIKKDLTNYKKEKETHSPNIANEKIVTKKIQKDTNKIQTTEPETFSANNIMHVETKKELNNNFFSIAETDEIRRAIVYTEIFDRKFFTV